MSTAVAKREEAAVAPTYTNVLEYINSGVMTSQLRQTMGDQRIAQRMARAVINAVTMTPKLAQCSVDSFRVAVMHAAVCNLIPGPSGHAAIIPYKGVATFQPMYKGIVQQLWRSDQIATIVTKTVDENDRFAERVGAPPIHEVSPNPAGGDYTHVYALIGIKGGGWIVEVWNRAQVLAHRDKYSRAWQQKGANSPWGTAEEAMAKKTVLLQAAKLAPISEEASASIAAYELAEQGKTTFESAVQDIKADVKGQLAGMVEQERARQGNGDTPEPGESTRKEDATEAGTPTTTPASDPEGTTSDDAPAPGNQREQAKADFEAVCGQYENLEIEMAYEVLYDVAGLVGNERSKTRLKASDYQNACDDVLSLITLVEEKLMDRREMQRQEANGTAPEPAPVYEGPTADDLDFDG